MKWARAPGKQLNRGRGNVATGDTGVTNVITKLHSEYFMKVWSFTAVIVQAVCHVNI